MVGIVPLRIRKASFPSLSTISLNFQLFLSKDNSLSAVIAKELKNIEPTLLKIRLRYNDLLTEKYKVLFLL